MANTKITSRVIADDAILTANIADDQITSALIVDDVALGGNPTTSTQSAGNNTTKIATTAFVSTAVANIVNSAPSTLDTLGEIATALNNDAALNTTLTNSIAAKLPLAGGTMTGNIGIGVAPSTTIRNDGGAAERALQIGNRAMFFSDSGVTTDLQNNSHLNNSDVRVAMQTDLGSLYQQYQGIHKWFNAASVSAGATQTMTSRMVILADGKIGIGTDSPAHNLHVVSTGNAELEIERTSGAAVFTQAQSALGVTGTSSNHDFGLLTNGSVRMRILNDGKVGIGTASPSHMLHVNAADGASDNTQAMTIENNEATDGRSYGLKIKAGSTANDASLFVQDHDASNDHFIIRGNGAVGIGTTAPSTLLHLGGTAPGDSIIRQDSTSSGTNWEIGERAAGKWQIFEDDNDSIVATFMSTGNVGIGTTSPSHKLHVHSDAAKGFLLERDSGSNAANLNEMGTHYSLSILNRTSGSYLNFGGNSSHTVLQATDGAGSATAKNIVLNPYGGKVGIGTTSPDTLLNLKDTGGIEVRLEADSNNNGQEDCFIRFYTDGKTQEGIAGMDNNNSSTLFSGNTENAMVFGTVSNLPTIFATNNTERFHITSGGDISMGVTKKFSFSSDEDTYMSEYSANEFEIRTGGGRRFALSGGNTFISGSLTQNHNFSDERLKENIVVIPNALQKVSSLRGITFTRKADGSVGTGLIAQELEKVLPEAVFESKTIESLEDPDAEEYKSIRYETTVGLLVEAIKELEARIETLES